MMLKKTSRQYSKREKAKISHGLKELSLVAQLEPKVISDLNEISNLIAGEATWEPRRGTAKPLCGLSAPAGGVSALW